MMYDQLHVFPDKATAEAVFGDGEGAASWLHNGLTVMPCDIIVMGEEGSRKADGYWMGVATHIPEAAAAAQALPSCRVAYIRPETPTPWREAITWSAPGITDLTVIAAGSFAGSGYVFD